MKRILFFLILGILTLTFQTTLLGFVPIQRIRPDFMLIFTLYLGFSSPPIPGAILAFLMGYFVDLFSGNTLGLYTLSRPLLFYGAYLFKTKFYVEGYPSQFIFVFLSASLEGCLVLLLFTLLTPDPLFHFNPSFLLSLFPQATFTALITPVLFVLSQKGSDLIAGKTGVGVQERG